MRLPQFWAVLVCLLATLVTIHIRGDVDRVPPSAPLAQMPATFGDWTSRDIPISSEVLEILGKGDFLNRLYQQKDRALPPVQLFVGYFATQRSGQSIHSPQNCLPGSGWTFLSSGVTSFTDSTGKLYTVGEYLISDGRDKQEVLYWYQSHGRSIASDYKAKLLMLMDSIRLGRTDAALVRVITPMTMNEDQQTAHGRVVNFAKFVTPLLPAYVPN
jgi:EpsI family protein